MISNRHHNIQILDSNEVTLATIIAEGLAQQPVPLPAKLPPADDLRKQPVAHKREIVFSESPGKFFINGKQFAMDRVGTTVNLGDVEEWTIRVAGWVAKGLRQAQENQSTEIMTGTQT